MVNNVNVMYSDCTALGLYRSVKNFIYLLQEKLASHRAFVHINVIHLISKHQNSSFDTGDKTMHTQLLCCLNMSWQPFLVSLRFRFYITCTSSS